MIANYAAMDIRPGSMGRPLPGIEAAIVRATTADGARRGRSTRAGRRGRAGAAPGWPSMFRGYLDEEERYREVLRRRLVPDRRPRAARRRRLLLVRRPRRRRDQVRRPPDRPVRGRERADGAPGRGRGRRDRQARPGGRRDRQGVRRAEARPRAERRRCGASCSAHARKRLGAAVAPKEIDFRDDAAADAQRQDHAPAAQGARAGPARRRLCRRWRATSDERNAPPRPRARGSHLLRQMLRIRRFEEKCAELYSAAKIRGFLHLYIGEEAVAVGVMQALDAGGRRRRDLPRARPCAGPRHRPGRDHGRDVRQGRGLQPRPRRLDAPVRRRDAASTAATPSSAAGCRSPSAWRWPTRCAAAGASPPASSATARWPRASSTSR